MRTTLGIAVVTLLLSASAFTSASASTPYVTTPEAFGAKGDGAADDSAAIMNALASCDSHALASCRVVFNASYLSGPIRVNASNVTLDVRGVLTMLPKAKYLEQVNFITNGEGDPSRCRTDARGYRTCLENIRITGGGVISGAGTPGAPGLGGWAWWACKYTGCFRPHLFGMDHVRGLRIDGVTLTNPPNHHIETSGCVGVRIDNIKLEAPHASPNTDGVNFYGGFDQLLSNSLISNGDDCVSVVPTGDFYSYHCEAFPTSLDCSGGHVVVRNVTCLGGHGISIGGVRHGSVRNVTFANMTATGEKGSTQGKYSTGGVRIKSYPNSTGTVTDIRYHDILMKGVYLPIQLLGHYCPFPCKTADGNTSVKFANISFTRVVGTGKSSLVGDFECR